MDFFLRKKKKNLFRPRVVARSLGCGARREPACTSRYKCRSRPGSVARALGVQRREKMASNHGIAYRRATSIYLVLSRADQAHGKPPKLSFFFCFALCCCVPANAISSTPALKRCILSRSHGTAAVALQVFPCLTAMNRAFAYVNHQGSCSRASSRSYQV